MGPIGRHRGGASLGLQAEKPWRNTGDLCRVVSRGVESHGGDVVGVSDEVCSETLAEGQRWAVAEQLLTGSGRAMDYPDIESLRNSLGKELIGRLYFLPGSKKIILAPMYRNFESMDYEQEKTEVIPFDGPISFEELGRHACDTLLRCERKDRNLRNY